MRDWLVKSRTLNRYKEHLPLKGFTQSERKSLILTRVEIQTLEGRSGRSDSLGWQESCCVATLV